MQCGLGSVGAARAYGRHARKDAIACSVRPANIWKRVFVGKNEIMLDSDHILDGLYV
jgi:hypothetical protein